MVSLSNHVAKVHVLIRGDLSDLAMRWVAVKQPVRPLVYQAWAHGNAVGPCERIKQHAAIFT
jgi:hypothetical protein